MLAAREIRHPCSVLPKFYRRNSGTLVRNLFLISVHKKLVKVEVSLLAACIIYKKGKYNQADKITGILKICLKSKYRFTF